MELVHNEFLNQNLHQSLDGDVIIRNFEKGISFKNLSFSYKNSSKGTLSEISLDIPVKSSIAFVGESGAGKTTLVDLITLTNQTKNGGLFIDGFNSNEINKSSWRKTIGYVSQETLIFDDTISNNITMWQDQNSSIESIRDAAKKANILEFIDSLPDGFDTIVGDRGILLSGGQKQRLFIARELFRKPSLLILDEATSSLDSESEKNIQASIEMLKGKITVIIIAHRLSTIKNVDKIYLMKNGRIIEQGSYDELKSNETSEFSKLANHQVL
jgi:subfamily B ATP-binding cassette protein MsbA